jgi:16S rRNA (cytosine1402-N4)-methyltransferase
MDLPQTGHEPVLLNQVLHGLAPTAGQVVVDCTIGRAGHAKAMANLLGSQGLLIGLDVDPRNLEYASQQLAGVPCRVRLFSASFAELDQVLAQAEVTQVHAVLADLGVSTNQLFDPAYGLSFSNPMPLDMRLDPRLTRSAADYIAQLDERELANVLYELAQERWSRRIARKIAEARRLWPITTTDRLADIVRSAVGRRGDSSRRRGGAPEKIDPATRTFLALRMLVNRELQNLQRFLELAPRTLAATGRLAVISFQSMEDRLVKQAFRSAEQAGLLTLLTPKPLGPTPDEMAANPRSRSAKLRLAQRTSRNLP